MQYNYFIFYTTKKGFFGNTQVKCKKIKSIDTIRKIELAISKKINHDISIINFRKVGLAWKWK